MKDSIGTEVQVGDRVAFIKPSYGSKSLEKGIVIGFTPKGFDCQLVDVDPNTGDWVRLFHDGRPAYYNRPIDYVVKVAQ